MPEAADLLEKFVAKHPTDVARIDTGEMRC
jgi:hypothetical protein